VRFRCGYNYRSVLFPLLSNVSSRTFLEDLSEQTYVEYAGDLSLVLAIL